MLPRNVLGSQTAAGQPGQGPPREARHVGVRLQYGVQALKRARRARRPALPPGAPQRAPGRAPCAGASTGRLLYNDCPKTITMRYGVGSRLRAATGPPAAATLARPTRCTQITHYGVICYNPKEGSTRASMPDRVAALNTFPSGRPTAHAWSAERQRTKASMRWTPDHKGPPCCCRVQAQCLQDRALAKRDQGSVRA